MAQSVPNRNWRLDALIAILTKIVTGKASVSIQPFNIDGADRLSRILVLCDHATNRVPDEVGGTLGLQDADMARHIAYDVGGLGTARALAELLDAPCVSSDFSRLVIDPNRGEDDPTLVMRLYDGSIIPANRHVDEVEVARRVALFHRPYHRAVAGLVAARERPVLISIHSFTPQLQGRPKRPWDAGILYAEDRRLADTCLARLQETDLYVGDNEPYSGHLPGDTMDQHALRHGHAHVLIEIRNDLIEDLSGQMKWASTLAPIITNAINDAGV
jgi:predicted N-formylglutamate amidohydrolase